MKRGTFPFYGVTRYQRRKWAHVWEMFPRMVDVVPEGRSGPVKIRHFDVSPALAVLRCIERHELWTPGRFCQLEIGGEGWMYDTFHERIMNEAAVRNARGNVLIAGLGIGMILHPILAKAEVTSVRVLENSRHVQKLVMPSLDGVPGAEKLTLTMVRDALTWTPPNDERYDAIWLDCVPFYGYNQMVLDIQDHWYRTFLPFLAPNGWIDHWGMHEHLTWRLDRVYGGKVTRAFPMGDNPHARAAQEAADLVQFAEGTVVHADRDPLGEYLAGVGAEEREAA